jgi:alpha-tubulin suppressor-like RCC1 family protein
VSGVAAIATGSSHSLAIRPDGSLMAWGADYGPDPVQIMTGVTTVAAGSHTSIALKRDGSLWQWDRGDAKPRRLKFLRNTPTRRTR